MSEEGGDVLRRRSSGDEVDEEAGDVLRRRLSQPRAGGSRSSRCDRARAARRRARRRAASGEEEGAAASGEEEGAAASGEEEGGGRKFWQPAGVPWCSLAARER